MYSPRFSITNKILKSICQIEAAKEVIENAPLIPSYEKDFVSDAIARTVYHGTHIEGNDLTFSQTKQVLEGQEITARQRDIQEVINYRNVVALLDDLVNKRGWYDINMLTEIHAVVVYKIVPEEKAGKIRNTQVLIREEGTGRVIFTPPPFVEVPFLLEEFLAWLNSPEGKEIHPVLRAGIAHYILVAIHPFVEGNGRTARAFAVLILLKEGYDIKRFFSLEEHFDKDLSSYYEAFFKVDSQSPNIADRDLTPWLEYFSEVLAIELTKIKDKVKTLSVDSHLKVRIGAQIALSERQVKLVEFLSEKGWAIMKDLAGVLPMISEDTILRDLKDLMAKGIVKKRGSTKGSRYVLATQE